MTFPMIFAIGFLVLACVGWLLGVMAFFRLQRLEQNQERLENELRGLARVRHRRENRPEANPEATPEFPAPVQETSAVPPVMPDLVPPTVSAPPLHRPEAWGSPVAAMAAEKVSFPPPLPFKPRGKELPPPVAPSAVEHQEEESERAEPDDSWVSRWALRAGAVLGVMAILFLVYQLNLNSPPWLRWGALMAFATGLAVFGRIGSARGWILAQPARPAGLALAHLGVFAGYAFPAVRVFETPLIGAIAMTVATVVLGGICLWENRPKTCAMILVIGQVCALFLQGDVGGIWLPAQGLGLLALAAWVRATRGWETCLGLAFVGHVAQLTTLGMDGEDLGVTASTFTALAVTGWLITALAELWAFRKNPDAPFSTFRLSLPAAFGAGLSVLYANQFGTETLWPLWLLWTGLFAGASALARLVSPASPAGPVFELHAWSALAATMVAKWAGDARWLALMIEAGLLLWRSARTENLWLRGLAWALWLGSLVTFADWRDGRNVWLSGWWNDPFQPSLAAVRPLLLHVLMLTLASAWHGLVYRWTIPHAEARLWGRAVSLLGFIAVACSLAFGEALSPAAISLVWLLCSLLWLVCAGLLSAPWLAWSGFAGWLAAGVAAMAGRFLNVETGLVEFDPSQADPARIPSLAAVLLMGLAFLGRVPAGVARSVVGLVSGALAVTLIGTVNCGVVPPLAVLALILAVLPLVVKESPWGELRAGLAWGSFWLLPEALSAWKPTATSWELVAAGSALLAVALWHLHTDREHPLRRVGLLVAGLLGILAMQTATVPLTGAPLAAGLAFGLVLLLRPSGRPGWIFAAALLVFGALKMVGLVAALGREDLSGHLVAGLTLLLLLLTLGFGVVRQKALDVSLRHGLLLLGGLALPMAWQWSWLVHKWPFGAAVSLGWSVVPLVFLAVGVWLRLRPLRIAGGLWLVPVFLRVLAVDLADTTQRVIAVGALSALLLLVGWGYRRAAAWLREDGC